MKQSIILKEEYYLSATGCGFEINPVYKQEVIMFLRGLKGLQYSFTSNRENHDQLFVSFKNGELIPYGESDKGWDFLKLEWEEISAQENLKLYRIGIAYGACVIAAKSKSQVLDIILKNDSLRNDFSNLDGKVWPKVVILKFITPIEGYEVKGKSGIISYFRE